MKILKMRLENFQGVKELEIDPQGESSAIYGDNGTGKSTVYNAFTWLMYGKPSTTEKNYTGCCALCSYGPGHDAGQSPERYPV